MIRYYGINRIRNKDTEASGEANFSGTNATTTVTNSNINEGDDIVIMPNDSSLNEVLFVSSVLLGSFVVTRSVVNVVSGLTNNLGFKWRKI